MNKASAREATIEDHKGHSGHKMKQLVKNLDMFGSKLPQFNISGKEVEQTFSGAIMSIMIFSVIIMFSILKLQHLLQRSNPYVNRFDVEDHFTIEKRFDTRQTDF